MDLFTIVKRSENPNMEKLNTLLKKSIEKYTFLSAEDFEIMQTKKPIMSHLMVQTLKTSIFEIVKTSIIATGFNNLYRQNDINSGLIVMFLACLASVIPNLKYFSVNFCFLLIITSIFVENPYF
jgi:hypothetical protein